MEINIDELPYHVGGLLYTPALNDKIADKLIRGKISALTSLVFCLEDSIMDEKLEDAEEQLKVTLAQLAEANAELPLLFVRVRTPRHMARVHEFIGPLEKLVCLLVPAREGENEEDDMKLKYIGGGLLSTAELSVLEAKKEVNVFISRLLRMYGMVQDLLQTTKVEEFNKLYSRIEKYEGITDRMEIEIADYLTQVSEGRLSVESKLDIQRMMRVCSELESIGDSCFNMARTMKHKRQYGTEDFTEAQYQHIHSMMGLVGEALAEMQVAIQMSESRSVSLNKNYNTENEINNYRDQLKNQNIIDVNDKLYDYQMGVFYMDIISECEKLGDYIINVLESSGLKK